MKKIIYISLVAIILLVGFIVYFYSYLNGVSSISEVNGRYYNEDGKEIGTCVIQTKVKRLADVAEKNTFYYSIDKQEYIGQCEGASTGDGCFRNTKNTPIICNKLELQTTCDKGTYPVGFGARAKYKCVIK